MAQEIRVLDQPFRPLAMKLINQIGGLSIKAGFNPFRLESRKLIALAARKAGVTDTSVIESCKPALEKLLDAIHGESRLNFLGYMMAQQNISSNLANYLRVSEWRKLHPEIADEKIEKPLFIIGLPRTGTTILHALLDVDPANRSPLFWEVEFPVPPASPSSWLTDPRIRENQKMLDQLDKVCPGFDAVHPMGASMPQECVAIFAHLMMSEHFHMTFDVPSYIEWLDDQDMRDTYHYHKMFLQHLQSGGVKGERWLLKSPCHLHLIEQLLETYPDANIIHTHRDPVSVCASVTSLAAMLRGVASDHIDTRAIANQQLDWWEKLLKSAVKQRKALESKSSQFFDLKMSETVQDPVGSVERIYRHFNLELTDEVKQRMQEYMRSHPRDKHGSHTYKPEDFGIDPTLASKRFVEYKDYFGLN